MDREINEWIGRYPKWNEIKLYEEWKSSHSGRKRIIKELKYHLRQWNRSKNKQQQQQQQGNKYKVDNNLVVAALFILLHCGVFFLMLFKYLYIKSKNCLIIGDLPKLEAQCQCQTTPLEFYKIAMERKIAIIFRRFSISYHPILSHTRRTECVRKTNERTLTRLSATHNLWQAFCLNGETENL